VLFFTFSRSPKQVSYPSTRRGGVVGLFRGNSRNPRLSAFKESPLNKVRAPAFFAIGLEFAKLFRHHLGLVPLSRYVGSIQFLYVLVNTWIK